MKKMTCIAALAALTGLARGAGAGGNALAPLPCLTPPDTEAATNVTLDVRYGRMASFGLSIDTESCVSNEVLVAVGRDSDGDGDLSYGEAAFVYGIECGERYLVDLGTGTVSTNVPAMLRIKAKHFDPRWNMLKVVKRGEGQIGESVVTDVERRTFSISIK